MKTRDMSLAHALADPLIRQVMASDGVAEADILALAERARARRAPPAAARRAWPRQVQEHGCQGYA